MCSAPLSADVKVCVPQVKKKNMVAVYCALCWRAASPR
jgi:hypothetical protein